MINSIYNYYMSTYNPPASPKQNLHKRSELRSIYNSIVNINKQSPLFKVMLSDDVQKCAFDIKESAIALNSFTDTYRREEEDTSFGKKIATSNNNAVSVQIVTDKHDNLPRDLSIKVDSLAASQVNASRDTLTDLSGISEGNYFFTIDIDNNIYEFEFSVNNKESNKTILTKLGRAINKANIGIKASVENGAKSNTTKLILSSEQTGTDDGKPNFILEDLKHTGSTNRGIINFYNLNNIVVEPVNSVFIIDDTEYESNSNTFVYDNALEISLNAITDDEVSISYSSDSTEILDSLDHFIKTFNNLINVTRKHSDEQRSPAKLLSDLTDITMEHINELSSTGLIVEKDGTLTADKALTVQSADDGVLKSFLYNESGFVKGVSQKSREIVINPMNYVDKMIVTYPNPYARNYPNPYITSMYSGMLFNYYC